MGKKLPSDLDIFSSSTRIKPLHPVIPPGVAVRALALSAISFSWCGNCKSAPPPWMSKMLAQVVAAHRRALDMPARPASPHWRRSRRLARFSRLSTTQSPADHACTGSTSTRSPARRSSNDLPDNAASRQTHGVIRIAIGRRVGLAVGDQLGNQRQHAGDYARWRVARGGAHHARCVRHPWVHRVDKALGQRLDGFTVFNSA